MISHQNVTKNSADVEKKSKPTPSTWASTRSTWPGWRSSSWWCSTWSGVALPSSLNFGIVILIHRGIHCFIIYLNLFWFWLTLKFVLGLLKFCWLLLRPHPPCSPQLGLVAGSVGAGVNTSVWSWTASRWGRTRPGTAWGWRGSWSTVTVMECSLGALTIQGLLPGRVRGRHPTVILGVRGAHHKAE